MPSPTGAAMADVLMVVSPGSAESAIILAASASEDAILIHFDCSKLRRVCNVEIDPLGEVRIPQIGLEVAFPDATSVDAKAARPRTWVMRVGRSMVVFARGVFT